MIILFIKVLVYVIVYIVTISNPSVKSLVIQGFLNGKSRDQLALEARISTGKASNIIKDWKNAIGIPDVEELRDFSVTVRKSGISIDECVQGYRMVQLMKSLGIADDEDEDGTVNVINNNNRSSSNNRIGNYNEFSSFVQEIYMNCKKFGIKPGIIFSWIKDLFDCYSPTNIPYPSFIDGQKMEKGKDTDTKSKISDRNMPIPFFVVTDSITKPDFEDPLNHNSNIIINNTSARFNTKQQNDPLVHKVPFISQISHFIAQKKKQCIGLENYKKEIEKDIKTAESKRNEIQFDLEALKQENNYVMHYIDWYYDLKKELLERYSIGINDFERFTSVIKRF
jgi:hypothetical protein